MAISLVGVGTFQKIGNGTSYTQPVPAGSQPGDLLIIYGVSGLQGGMNAWILPDGWTYVLGNYGYNGNAACIAYKISAGESSIPIVVNNWGWAGNIVVYRGVSGIEAFRATGGYGTGKSLSLTSGSTSVDNSYIVSIGLAATPQSVGTVSLNITGAAPRIAGIGTTYVDYAGVSTYFSVADGQAYRPTAGTFGVETASNAGTAATLNTFFHSQMVLLPDLSPQSGEEDSTQPSDTCDARVSNNLDQSEAPTLSDINIPRISGWMSEYEAPSPSDSCNASFSICAKESESPILSEIYCWDIFHAGHWTLNRNYADVDGFVTSVGTTPYFVSAGTATYTSAASTPLPLPAGYQNGDILVMNSWDIAPTNISGWTQLLTSSLPAANIYIHWIRVSGTVPTPNIGNGASACAAVIYAFRGCVTTGNPVDNYSVGGANSNSSINIPSYSTTNTNTLPVCIGGNAPYGGTPDPFTSSTGTATTSENAQIAVGSGGGNGMQVWTGPLQVAAGANVGQSLTCTTAPYSNWGVLLSLNLQPGTGITTFVNSNVTASESFGSINKAVSFEVESTQPQENTDIANRLSKNIPAEYSTPSDTNSYRMLLYSGDQISENPIPSDIFDARVKSKNIENDISQAGTITYVGSGPTATYQANIGEVYAPTGILPGDVIFLTIDTLYNQNQTAIYPSIEGTWNTLTGFGNCGSLFWKYTDGTDVSFTIDGTHGSYGSAFIFAYRNCSPVNTIGAYSYSQAAGATASPASLTTLIPGSTLVVIGGGLVQDPSLSWIAPVVGPVPATLRYSTNEYLTGSYQTSLALWDIPQVVPGPTGSPTVSYSDGTSVTSFGQFIALSPVYNYNYEEETEGLAIGVKESESTFLVQNLPALRPTFVAAGTVVNTLAQTTLAVPFPAGIQTGDLLIIQANDLGTGLSLPTPLAGGWANLGSYASCVNTVWYKIAVLPEQPVVLKTTTSNCSFTAVMVAYRGVDPINPIDVYDPVDNVVGGANSLVSSTLTTTYANDLLIYSAYGWASTSLLYASASGATPTARVATNIHDIYYTSLILLEGPGPATPNTTSTTTVNVTGTAVNDSIAGQIFALKGAVAPDTSAKNISFGTLDDGTAYVASIDGNQLKLKLGVSQTDDNDTYESADAGIKFKSIESDYIQTNIAPVVPTLVGWSNVVIDDAAPSMTVQVPSGIQSGDLLILAWGSEVGTYSISGWTSLQNIFYKITDGTDTQVVFPNPDGNLISAAVVAYRGVNQGNPIDGYMIASGSGTQASLPYMVTQYANERLLAIGYYVSGSPDPVWAAPTGTVANSLIVSGDNAVLNMFQGLALYDGTQATKGVTGSVVVNTVNAPDTQFTLQAYSIIPPTATDLYIQGLNLGKVAQEVYIVSIEKEQVGLNPGDMLVSESPTPSDIENSRQKFTGTQNDGSYGDDPFFVGAGPVAVCANNSVPVYVPDGIQAGDVLLFIEDAAYAVWQGGINIPVISGSWNLLASGYGYVYWKYTDGTDTSFTLTGTNPSFGSGFIAAYRSCNSINPISAVGLVSQGAANGVGLTSITPSIPNSTILAIGVALTSDPSMVWGQPTGVPTIQEITTPLNVVSPLGHLSSLAIWDGTSTINSIIPSSYMSSSSDTLIFGLQIALAPSYSYAYEASDLDYYPPGREFETYVFGVETIAKNISFGTLDDGTNLVTPFELQTHKLNSGDTFADSVAAQDVNDAKYKSNNIESEYSAPQDIATYEYFGNSGHDLVASDIIELAAVSQDSNEAKFKITAKEEEFNVPQDSYDVVVSVPGIDSETQILTGFYAAQPTPWANWSNFTVSLTANIASPLAPNGTASAYRLTSSNGGPNAYYIRGSTISYVAGQQYAIGFWGKWGGGEPTTISMPGDSANFPFNVADGVIYPSGGNGWAALVKGVDYNDYRIIAGPDGWYYCYASFTAKSTTNVRESWGVTKLVNDGYMYSGGSVYLWEGSPGLSDAQDRGIASIREVQEYAIPQDIQSSRSGACSSFSEGYTSTQDLYRTGIKFPGIAVESVQPLDGADCTLTFAGKESDPQTASDNFKSTFWINSQEQEYVTAQQDVYKPGLKLGVYEDDGYTVQDEDCDSLYRITSKESEPVSQFATPQFPTAISNFSAFTIPIGGPYGSPLAPDGTATAYSLSTPGGSGPNTFYTLGTTPSYVVGNQYTFGYWAKFGSGSAHHVFYSTDFTTIWFDVYAGVANSGGAIQGVDYDSVSMTQLGSTGWYYCYGQFTARQSYSNTYQNREVWGLTNWTSYSQSGDIIYIWEGPSSLLPIRNNPIDTVNYGLARPGSTQESQTLSSDTEVSRLTTSSQEQEYTTAQEFSDVISGIDTEESEYITPSDECSYDFLDSSGVGNSYSKSQSESESAVDSSKSIFKINLSEVEAEIAQDREVIGGISLTRQEVDLSSSVLYKYTSEPLPTSMGNWVSSTATLTGPYGSPQSPEGSPTAYSISTGATGGPGTYYITGTTQTYVVGNTYSFGFWAKYGSGSSNYVYYSTDSAKLYFDINNGVFYPNGAVQGTDYDSVSIIQLSTNGWYYCYGTFKARTASKQEQWGIYNGTANSQAGDTVYIWEGNLGIVYAPVAPQDNELSSFSITAIESEALTLSDSVLASTISYVGSGAAFQWNVNTTAAAVPAGIQNNDILVLWYYNWFAPPTTPSGWTLVPGYSTNASQANVYVMWKRTTGAESAPTVGSAGTAGNGWMSAYRGCATSGSPFGPIGNSANVTSGTVLTTPSVTGITPGSMVLSACGFLTNVAAPSWTSPPATGGSAVNLEGSGRWTMGVTNTGLAIYDYFTQSSISSTCTFSTTLPCTDYGIDASVYTLLPSTVVLVAGQTSQFSITTAYKDNLAAAKDTCDARLKSTNQELNYLVAGQDNDDQNASFIIRAAETEIQTLNNPSNVIYVGSGAPFVWYGTLTAAVPAGIQANDILVIWCFTGPTIPSIPSGWSVVPGYDASTGSLFAIWKRTNGVESTPAPTGGSGWMSAYRGCDPLSSNPWGSVSNSANNISGTTVTAPSISVVKGSLVLNTCVYSTQWPGNYSDNWSSPPATGPGAVNLEVSQQWTSTYPNAWGAAVYDYPSTSDGQSKTCTFSIASVPTNNLLSSTYVLLPPPSPDAQEFDLYIPRAESESQIVSNESQKSSFSITGLTSETQSAIEIGSWDYLKSTGQNNVYNRGVVESLIPVDVDSSSCIIVEGETEAYQVSVESNDAVKSVPVIEEESEQLADEDEDLLLNISVDISDSVSILDSDDAIFSICTDEIDSSQPAETYSWDFFNHLGNHNVFNRGTIEAASPQDLSNARVKIANTELEYGSLLDINASGVYAKSVEAELAPLVPTYIGAGAATSGWNGGSAITVTLPTDTIVGDLLLLHVWADNYTSGYGSFHTIPGWTLSAGSGQSSAIYWTIATKSTAPVQLWFAVSTFSGVIYGYRGCDTSNPIDGGSGGNNGANGHSDTFTISGYTTTKAITVPIAFGAGSYYCYYAYSATGATNVTRDIQNVGNYPWFELFEGPITSISGSVSSETFTKAPPVTAFGPTWNCASLSLVAASQQSPTTPDQTHGLVIARSQSESGLAQELESSKSSITSAEVESESAIDNACWDYFPATHTGNIYNRDLAESVTAQDINGQSQFTLVEESDSAAPQDLEYASPSFIMDEEESVAGFDAVYTGQSITATQVESELPLDFDQGGKTYLVSEQDQDDPVAIEIESEANGAGAVEFEIQFVSPDEESDSYLISTNIDDHVESVDSQDSGISNGEDISQEDDLYPDDSQDVGQTHDRDQLEGDNLQTSDEEDLLSSNGSDQAEDVLASDDQVAGVLNGTDQSQVDDFIPDDAQDGGVLNGTDQSQEDDLLSIDEQDLGLDLSSQIDEEVYPDEDLDSNIGIGSESLEEGLYVDDSQDSGITQGSDNSQEDALYTDDQQDLGLNLGSETQEGDAYTDDQQDLGLNLGSDSVEGDIYSHDSQDNGTVIGYDISQEDSLQSGDSQDSGVSPGSDNSQNDVLYTDDQQDLGLDLNTESGEGDLHASDAQDLTITSNSDYLDYTTCADDSQDAGITAGSDNSQEDAIYADDQQDLGLDLGSDIQNGLYADDQQDLSLYVATEESESVQSDELHDANYAITAEESNLIEGVDLETESEYSTTNLSEKLIASDQEDVIESLTAEESDDVEPLDDQDSTITVAGELSDSSQLSDQVQNNQSITVEVEDYLIGDEQGNIAISLTSILVDYEVVSDDQEDSYFNINAESSDQLQGSDVEDSIMSATVETSEQVQASSEETTNKAIWASESNDEQPSDEMTVGSIIRLDESEDVFGDESEDAIYDITASQYEELTSSDDVLGCVELVVEEEDSSQGCDNEDTALGLGSDSSQEDSANPYDTQDSGLAQGSNNTQEDDLYAEESQDSIQISSLDTQDQVPYADDVQDVATLIGSDSSQDDSSYADESQIGAIPHSVELVESVEAQDSEDLLSYVSDDEIEAIEAQESQDSNFIITAEQSEFITSADEEADSEYCTTNLVEYITATDSQESSSFINVTLSDSLEPSDGAEACVTFAEDMSDSEETQDSETLELILGFNEIDSSVVSPEDYETEGLDLGTSESDYLEVSDEYTLSLAPELFESESIEPSDAEEVATQITSDQSDEGQGSDLEQALSVFAGELSESVEGYDQQDAYIAFAGEASEPEQGSDTQDASYLSSNNLSEQVLGDESCSASVQATAELSEQDQDLGFAQETVGLYIPMSEEDNGQPYDEQEILLTISVSESEYGQGEDSEDSSYSITTEQSEFDLGVDEEIDSEYCTTNLLEYSELIEQEHAIASINTELSDSSTAEDQLDSNILVAGTLSDSEQVLDYETLEFVAVAEEIDTSELPADQESEGLNPGASQSDYPQASDESALQITYQFMVPEYATTSESEDCSITSSSEQSEDGQASDQEQCCNNSIGQEQEDGEASDLEEAYIVFAGAESEYGEVYDQNDLSSYLADDLSESAQGSDLDSVFIASTAELSEQVEASDEEAEGLFIAVDESEIEQSTDDQETLLSASVSELEVGQVEDQSDVSYNITSEESESLESADLETESEDVTTNINENPKPSDEQDATYSITVGSEEQAQGLDSDDSATEITLDINDYAILSDEQSLVIEIPSDLEESMSGLDTQDLANTISVEESEAVQPDDNQDQFYSLSLDQSESVSGQDSQDPSTILPLDISESASGQDNQETVASLSLDASDSAQGFDEQSNSEPGYGALEESQEASDGQDLTLVVGSEHSDSQVPSDEQDYQLIQIFYEELSESISGSDEQDCALVVHAEVSESQESDDQQDLGLYLASDTLEFSDIDDYESACCLLILSEYEDLGGLADEEVESEISTTNMSERLSVSDQEDAQYSITAEESEDLSGLDHQDTATLLIQSLEEYFVGSDDQNLEITLQSTQEDYSEPSDEIDCTLYIASEITEAQEVDDTQDYVLSSLIEEEESISGYDIQDSNIDACTYSSEYQETDDNEDATKIVSLDLSEEEFAGDEQSVANSESVEYLDSQISEESSDSIESLSASSSDYVTGQDDQVCAIATLSEESEIEESSDSTDSTILFGLDLEESEGATDYSVDTNSLMSEEFEIVIYSADDEVNSEDSTTNANESSNPVDEQDSRYFILNSQEDSTEASDSQEIGLAVGTKQLESETPASESSVGGIAFGTLDDGSAYATAYERDNAQVVINTADYGDSATTADYQTSGIHYGVNSGSGQLENPTTQDGCDATLKFGSVTALEQYTGISDNHDCGTIIPASLSDAQSSSGTAAGFGVGFQSDTFQLGSASTVSSQVQPFDADSSIKYPGGECSDAVTTSEQQNASVRASAGQLDYHSGSDEESVSERNTSSLKDTLVVYSDSEDSQYSLSSDQSESTSLFDVQVGGVNTIISQSEDVQGYESFDAQVTVSFDISESVSGQEGETQAIEGGTESESVQGSDEQDCILLMVSVDESESAEPSDTLELALQIGSEELEQTYAADQDVDSIKTASAESYDACEAVDIELASASYTVSADEQELGYDKDEIGLILGTDTSESGTGSDQGDVISIVTSEASEYGSPESQDDSSLDSNNEQTDSLLLSDLEFAAGLLQSSVSEEYVTSDDNQDTAANLAASEVESPEGTDSQDNIGDLVAEAVEHFNGFDDQDANFDIQASLEESVNLSDESDCALIIALDMTEDSDPMDLESESEDLTTNLKEFPTTSDENYSTLDSSNDQIESQLVSDLEAAGLIQPALDEEEHNDSYDNEDLGLNLGVSGTEYLEGIESQDSTGSFVSQIIEYPKGSDDQNSNFNIVTSLEDSVISSDESDCALKLVLDASEDAATVDEEDKTESFSANINEFITSSDEQDCIYSISAQMSEAPEGSDSEAPGLASDHEEVDYAQADDGQDCSIRTPVYYVDSEPVADDADLLLNVSSSTSENPTALDVNELGLNLSADEQEQAQGSDIEIGAVPVAENISESSEPSDISDEASYLTSIELEVQLSGDSYLSAYSGVETQLETSEAAEADTMSLDIGTEGSEDCTALDSCTMLLTLGIRYLDSQIAVDIEEATIKFRNGYKSGSLTLFVCDTGLVVDQVMSDQATSLDGCEVIQMKGGPEQEVLIPDESQDQSSQSRNSCEESINASDESTVGVVINPVISESCTLTDTDGASERATSTMSESAVIADRYKAGIRYGSTTSEYFVPTDLMTQRARLVSKYGDGPIAYEDSGIFGMAPGRQLDYAILDESQGAAASILNTSLEVFSSQDGQCSGLSHNVFGSENVGGFDESDAELGVVSMSGNMQSVSMLAGDLATTASIVGNDISTGNANAFMNTGILLNMNLRSVASMINKVTSHQRHDNKISYISDATQDNNNYTYFYIFCGFDGTLTIPSNKRLMYKKYDSLGLRFMIDLDQYLDMAGLGSIVDAILTTPSGLVNITDLNVNVIDAEHHSTMISMPAYIFTNLQKGAYTLDLGITDPTGIRRSLYRGPVIII